MQIHTHHTHIYIYDNANWEELCCSKHLPASPPPPLTFIVCFLQTYTDNVASLLLPLLSPGCFAHPWGTCLCVCVLQPRGFVPTVSPHPDSFPPPRGTSVLRAHTYPPTHTHTVLSPSLTGMAQLQFLAIYMSQEKLRQQHYSTHGSSSSLHTSSCTIHLFSIHNFFSSCKLLTVNFFKWKILSLHAW